MNTLCGCLLGRPDQIRENNLFSARQSVRNEELFEKAMNAMSGVAEAAHSFRRAFSTNEKYSLERDFDSVPDPCERFGLIYPE